MVKLPAFENSVGLTVPNFRPISGVDEVARGGANLAANLGRVSATLAQNDLHDEAKAEARATRDENLRAQSDSIDFKNNLDALFKAQVETAPPDGKDVLVNFDRAAADMQNKIMLDKYADAKDPQSVALRFKVARDAYTDKAANFEYERRLAFRKDVTDRTINDLSAAAIAPTANFAELSANYKNFIDTSISDNPKVREKMYEYGIPKLQRAFAEARVAEKPQEFVSAYNQAINADGSAKILPPHIQGTVDAARRQGMDPRTMLAIGKIESNLNPGAGRPTQKDGTEMSSAEGMWQVLNGPSQTAQQTRDAIGVTQDEVRKDPVGTGEKLAAFLVKKTDEFKRAGIEMTPGRQYMIWNVGEGAAKAIMTADPNENVADVIRRVYARNPALGETVIRNNPGLYKAGMTAGEVVSNYDQKIDAASRYADKVIQGSGLSPQDRARQALSSVLPEGSFDRLGPSEAADLADKASKVVASQAKNAVDIANGQARLSGVIPTDPYSAHQRGEVVKAIEPIARGITDQIAAGDVGGHAKTRAIVEAVSHIPEPIVNAYRAVIIGNGPAEAKAEAYAALNSIRRDKSVAFDASSIPHEMKERLENYSAYVDVLKLSPKDAIAKITYSESDEGKRVRLAVKHDVEKELKTITSATIRNVFDESSLSDPQFGFKGVNEAKIQALATDAYKLMYRDLREQGYDKDIATARAAKAVTDTWGVSRLFASEQRQTLQPHPPEKRYEAVDGSHAYVLEQAQNAAVSDLIRRGKFKPVEPTTTEDPVNGGTVTSSGFGIKEKSAEMRVMLVPTMQTDIDFRAGRPPRYELHYRNPDGTTEKAPDLFAADTLQAKSEFRDKQRAILERDKRPPDNTSIVTLPNGLSRK